MTEADVYKMEKWSLDDLFPAIESPEVVGFKALPLLVKSSRLG